VDEKFIIWGKVGKISKTLKNSEKRGVSETGGNA